MYKVEQLLNYANQKKSLTLPDGSVINMTLYYVDMQKGWFIRELTYGDFTVRGMRITRQPDLLYQFRNQIPFGLACFGTREPTLIDDFIEDVCQLYVLTEDEVEEYSEFLRA